MGSLVFDRSLGPKGSTEGYRTFGCLEFEEKMESVNCQNQIPVSIISHQLDKLESSSWIKIKTKGEGMNIFDDDYSSIASYSTGLSTKNAKYLTGWLSTALDRAVSPEIEPEEHQHDSPEKKLTKPFSETSQNCCIRNHRRYHTFDSTLSLMGSDDVALHQRLNKLESILSVILEKKSVGANPKSSASQNSGNHPPELSSDISALSVTGHSVFIGIGESHLPSAKDVATASEAVDDDLKGNLPLSIETSSVPIIFPSARRRTSGPFRRKYFSLLKKAKK